MRFVVDAQLPPALARWLSAKGHVAEHVCDFGREGTTDEEIWQHALATKAAIVTKDEDFVVRAMRDPVGAPVVWIRVGNTRRAALLDWFGRILPDLLKAIERGDRVVEVS